MSVARREVCHGTDHDDHDDHNPSTRLGVVLSPSKDDDHEEIVDEHFVSIVLRRAQDDPEPGRGVVSFVVRPCHGVVLQHRGVRMFVHAVYFWFKSDLSAEQTATVVQGIHSLTTIKTVHHGYAGVAASTDRPVIDRSYSYALIVIFKDQQAHDLYQTDPIHDRFRELCSAFWEKVVIYDSVG
jgi:hypothetical protein